MKFKRKLWITGILVVILCFLIFLLPDVDPTTRFYERYIYYPSQSFRNIVFGIIPISIGDILYIVGGFFLLLTLIRWIYFLRKFGAYKERLAASILRGVNTALLIYILFLLGWGINYNKSPLGESWGLRGVVLTRTQNESQKAKTLAEITAFDKFLVERINTTAQQYRALPFDHINERAKAYYRVYTDSKVKQNGLGIKPMLFSYFMERLAIEGYYNPFTGEGQVNKSLPAFTLPFVICHEMAHQAGIAAEGDANLMAYALGTMANDPVFNYSAYLNIWLYTNSRLYHRDSIAAKALEEQLNPLTKMHLDTLEQRSRMYHNDAARYSTDLYDSYLKLNQQKDGIRSYGNVSALAMQLEQKRRASKTNIIKVP